MLTRPCDPMFDLKDDFRTDHALILVGIGAALIALIYLVLT
jgi:hypothetical protein